MFITFEAEITPNGLIKIPEEYRHLINGRVSVTITHTETDAQRKKRKEATLKLAGSWSDFTDEDLAGMFPRAFRFLKDGSNIDDKENS